MNQANAKRRRRDPWHATWPWLAVLVVSMAIITYFVRPRPASGHSAHPVFTPPAEMASMPYAQPIDVPGAGAGAGVGASGNAVAPPAAPDSAASPPATTQPVAAQAAPAPGPVGPDGAMPVSFQFLGDFNYDPPGPSLGGTELTSSLDPPKAPEAPPVIPAKVRALDGKKVGIQGFMIPLGDMEAGQTSQFALVAVIPGCFYCQPPALNQYVMVTTKPGKAVTYPGPTPVLVTGKLSVGEHRDGDMVDSIYRMVADDVVESPVDQPGGDTQPQF